MAMVYDYDSGPAWRENAGLSAETWVEPDTASYGARYAPQRPAPQARGSSRLQRGYIDPQQVADDSADLAYARQAKVYGSTANYLMYGFNRDYGELSSAVRQGDTERARLIRDRMARFRDEHMDSLVEWTGVANGRQGDADRFAATADAILSESYMDKPVVTAAGGDGISVRGFLDAQSPEAVKHASENARRKLNLSADAALVYSDPNNPLYDSLDSQRRDYQAARRAFDEARTPEAQAQARSDEQRAVLSLQLAADFAAAHGDDPTGVRDFLSGASAGGFSLVSRGEMDDMYRMFRSDLDSGRVRNSADWFGGMSSALSSIGPVQRRVRLDPKSGKPTVVDEESEFTRPERLPGLVLQTRRILEENGYNASDFGAIGASLKDRVQKADIVARMAKVPDIQFLGLGDGAVAATVYEFSGRDPALMNASDRGKALSASATSLDDAYALGVRLANSMGVEIDESTPVNTISTNAPGMLGATAKQVFQAVYRSKLPGRGNSADGLVNEVASILGRGDAGGRDYHGLAERVVERLNRNFESGTSMDFGSVLREIGGGLRVGVVQTPNGAVPASVRIIPPGARLDVDYATGLPMTSDPGSGNLLTTDVERRKGIRNPGLVAIADKALRDMSSSALPYEDALKDSGIKGLANSVRSAAAGIAKIHEDVDIRGEQRPSTEGLVKPVGALMLDNFRKCGVAMDGESADFIESGDLLRFLDGHDKAKYPLGGASSGDNALLSSASAFADSLASRLKGGDLAIGSLFARVAIELMNRGGVNVTSPTAELLERAGVKTTELRTSHRLGAPGVSVLTPRDLSDTEASEEFTRLQNNLQRMFGQMSDVLRDVGYVGHDIGKMKIDNDYTGIFRNFDLNWRKDAPTVTPTPYAGNIAAQDVPPDYDADAAAAANHVLNTMTSGSEALDELMVDYLGNIAHMFDDPAAAQNYVQLNMAYVRSKIKNEGIQAARDWVARQGTLRRHLTETGTVPGGDYAIGSQIITYDQWRYIVDNEYGGNDTLYYMDQKRRRGLEGVKDKKLLTMLAAQSVSDD